MERSEVMELINNLRDEFDDKLTRVQNDLQETIDNLCGDVDRLNRDLDNRS